MSNYSNPEVPDHTYEEMYIPQERLEMERNLGMEQNMSYNRTDTQRSDLRVGSGMKKQFHSKKLTVIIACAVTALVVNAVACTVAIGYGFREIAKLESETTSLQYFEEIKVYSCILLLVLLTVLLLYSFRQ